MSKLLVIGSGGREHALAWKLAQGKDIEHVFVAPGNAGIALDNKLSNVDIAVNDFDGLVNFAKDNAIEFTVVGPEAPLVDGVVDFFKQHNLLCFGPSAKAAQLEGSKTFTKDFLARHNIPTAAYKTFTDPEAAKAYVTERGAPIVVKADGLAAGKGVIVATTLKEAHNAIDNMLQGNQFGEAGHRVVIEDFLDGEEASFIVVTDGEDFVCMATSQDHKRVGENDTGPNTGGMGAYSPAPVVTPEVEQRIIEQIIKPTINGLRAEDNRYTGFLYAGLMINHAGEPKVIEYNCRFGDPETQPIMMRLESDFAELCRLTLQNNIQDYKICWSKQASLGVVLAAGGYPANYEKGKSITGLTANNNTQAAVFHAGTKTQDDNIVTNGGRVLCATALGSTIAEAKDNAYKLTKTINWDGMFFRSDIGHRALKE